MKNIYALLIIAVLAVGCSKSNDDPTPDPGTVQTENPSTPVPATAITVLKTGNDRTVTITGKFTNFYFDQDYHKADGSVSGTKPSIRTYYSLEYDKVTLNSNGSVAFKFVRTGAYTYILTHTVLPDQFETNRIVLVNFEATPTTNFTKDY